MRLMLSGQNGPISGLFQVYFDRQASEASVAFKKGSLLTADCWLLTADC